MRKKRQETGDALGSRSGTANLTSSSSSLRFGGRRTSRPVRAMRLATMTRTHSGKTSGRIGFASNVYTARGRTED